MVRHDGVGMWRLTSAAQKTAPVGARTQAPAARIRVSEPRVSQRQPRSLVGSGEKGLPLLWSGITQDRNQITVLRDKRPCFAASR
jgi:hypothetical protein